jgi:hypothetical protein
VFILKVVKVICFDTLLQVFILKVDRGGPLLTKSAPQRGMAVAGTRRSGLPEAPIPRVFCAKRSDLLDYKGVDVFVVAKEFARVSGERS